VQKIWDWGVNRHERVSLFLIAGYLLVLLMAGGSSRSDVLGQFVVRSAAWLMVIISVLRGISLRDWRGRPALLGLITLASLMMLQLIPLPPAVWLALPGREVIAKTALAMGQPQPWRPLSMSPSATLNSLGALIVPAAIIFAAKDLSYGSHRILSLMILAIVFAGCILGVTQIVGTAGDNPLINDIKGMVGGNFANRNHFALFLAIGVILLGLAVAAQRSPAKTSVYAALISMPILVMMGIATGSRMGLLVLALAIALAGVMSRKQLARLLSKQGRVQTYSVFAIPLVLVGTTVLLSVFVGRAVSLDRAAEMSLSADYRNQALPVLFEMLVRYFPVGAGFGTFDPVFRISEPDALLRAAYFNHAHNDWLEFVIEGGLFSAALGVFALWWWAGKFYAAWSASGQENHLPRAGTAILLMCLVASLSDYPLRTPAMMAVAAIAALWTGMVSRESKSPEAPSAAMG
jgi:O-antigen ligase